MEYNSDRKDLIIPEYGRYIHQMVDYTIDIEDREKRQRYAENIISIMGVMNPQLKNIPDFKHKLWDHLFIMSNFKLDIDCPYDKLTEIKFREKPKKIDYPDRSKNYKYYGNNIKVMILEVCKEEDSEKKDKLAVYLANHLKKMYVLWNSNYVDDKDIFRHLKDLSNGEIDLTDSDKKLSDFTNNSKSNSNNYKNNSKNNSKKNGNIQNRRRSHSNRRNYSSRG